MIAQLSLFVMDLMSNELMTLQGMLTADLNTLIPLTYENAKERALEKPFEMFHMTKEKMVETGLRDFLQGAPCPHPYHMLRFDMGSLGCDVLFLHRKPALRPTAKSPYTYQIYFRTAIPMGGDEGPIYREVEGHLEDIEIRLLGEFQAFVMALRIQHGLAIHCDYGQVA